MLVDIKKNSSAMENPFKKEDRSGLIIGAIVAGALAAGAGIWFYLRGKRAAEAEAYRHGHAQDYLKAKQKKKKKHKTDVSDLAGVVNHENG
jgi:uncharacterized protein HemX